MESSVIEILFKHAKIHPEKSALIINDRIISYSQLAKNIIAAAKKFESDGITFSNRIILAAKHSASFVFGYFAAHLLGAIAVPVDPQISEKNLNNIIEQTSPSKIFLAKKNFANSKSIEELDDQLSAYDVNEFPTIKNINDEIADILFTTGTTGKPKGVVLTHKNILSAAQNINQFIGNTFEDREVIPLPLSHSFGLGRLRCNIISGSTMILCESIVLVKKIFDNIQKWNATGFGSVPAGFELLLKMSGNKLNEFASQLKYIEIGSSAMDIKTKLKLMSLLPKTKICMHYGLTEASRSCFIEFHSDKEKLNSVGKPSPNVNIKILDEQKEIVPTGNAGSIYISGNHVMKEYWNLADSTDNTFYNNWLNTGDVGKLDEENYLYLLGRQNEIINVGGLKVCPDEIEEFLQELDFIEDSACVGIPDPKGISGEMIKSFIVLKSNSKNKFSKLEIVDYLRQRIEQYKIPTEFEIIEKIPRTSSGKIQRQLLRN